MKIRVDTQVGMTKYTFEFEEAKELEALNKAIVLGNPPKYCNCCGNNQYFTLDTNKDKEGNIYINMKCLGKDCYAKAKLGVYKSGGYFWHKFQKYEGKPAEAKETTVDNIAE